MILGYLILNEVLTTQTIVAALIILGGVVLVQLSKVMKQKSDIKILIGCTDISRRF